MKKKRFNLINYLKMWYHIHYLNRHIHVITDKQNAQVRYHAKQVLQLLNKQGTKDFYYYSQAGVMLFLLGDLKNSLRYQQIAIHKKSSIKAYATAYRNMGLCEAFSKQITKGIQALKKSANLNPNNYHTFNYLSTLYDIKNNPEKAIQYQKKAFEVHKNAKTCALVGEIYKKYNDTTNAIKYTQKALKDYHPRDKKILYYNLGIMYSDLALFNPSIDCLKKVLNNNNDSKTNSECYFYIGSDEMDLEHKQKGIKAIEHAIALKPSNDYYYNQFGIVLFNAKKRAWGLNEMKRAIALNPQNVAYYQDVIKALKIDKQFKVAQKYERQLEKIK